MHLVQTLALRTLPFSSLIVTFWMLGLNQRLVTRWEWLTLRPATGCFPHTSQTFDISHHSISSNSLLRFKDKPQSPLLTKSLITIAQIRACIQEFFVLLEGGAQTASLMRFVGVYNTGTLSKALTEKVRNMRTKVHAEKL